MTSTTPDLHLSLLRHILQRSQALIALTRVNHFLVQFYRNGSFSVTIEARRWRSRRGLWLFFDLTRPCTIEAERVDNLALAVSPDLLLPLVANPDSIHGLVLAADNEANVPSPCISTTCAQTAEMTSNRRRRKPRRWRRCWRRRLRASKHTLNGARVSAQEPVRSNLPLDRRKSLRPLAGTRRYHPQILHHPADALPDVRARGAS